jgi:hypothetical protein
MNHILYNRYSRINTENTEIDNQNTIMNQDSSNSNEVEIFLSNVELEIERNYPQPLQNELLLSTGTSTSTSTSTEVIPSAPPDTIDESEASDALDTSETQKEIIRIQEHRTNIINNNPYKDDTCIICLESIRIFSTFAYEYLIDLNQTEFYSKECNCRYHIHHSCLEQTQLYSGRRQLKCIICSAPIIKNFSQIGNYNSIYISDNEYVNMDNGGNNNDDNFVHNTVFDNLQYYCCDINRLCYAICSNIFNIIMAVVFVGALVAILILR